MKTRRILTDIPADQVDVVVKDFLSEGAAIKTILQPDGLWTVEADFDVEQVPAEQS